MTSCHGVHLNPLYIAQRKAFKIALQLPYRTSSDIVFKTAKVLPLKSLFTLYTSVFMFKYHSSSLPVCFQSYFIPPNQNSTMNSRFSSLYRLPLFSTNYCQQSILFQGPKTWHKLPPIVRCSTSLPAFKYSAKSTSSLLFSTVFLPYLCMNFYIHHPSIFFLLHHMLIVTLIVTLPFLKSFL